MSQIEGQPPLPHVNIRPSYRGVPVLDRGLLPGPGRDVPNIGCDMAPAFSSKSCPPRTHIPPSSHPQWCGFDALPNLTGLLICGEVIGAEPIAFAPPSCPPLPSGPPAGWRPSSGSGACRTSRSGSPAASGTSSASARPPPAPGITPNPHPRPHPHPASPPSPNAPDTHQATPLDSSRPDTIENTFAVRKFRGNHSEIKTTP